MINRLIIGAPFGNYLQRPGITSTLGTYTWEHRAGFWKRWWRILWTVRYHRRTQSWTNRLGLPNPGLRSLKTSPEVRNSILSIHGFNEDEWLSLVRYAVERIAPLALEFNLSCPNVGAVPGMLADIQPAIHTALDRGVRVIAKLPPVRWMDLARPLYGMGVRAFHACNTMPVPAGGLSGKPLKQFSLWAVRDLRDAWGPDVTLIGGGGVICPDDVRDYLAAGADHVAVASILLNPLNWWKLPVLRDAAEVVKEPKGSTQ